MTIVNLATGEPIEEAIPAPDLLVALKELVVRIETGEFKIKSFYLIVDHGDRTESFDSDLTVYEAISLLEQEKFAILCGLYGIKT